MKKLIALTGLCAVLFSACGSNDKARVKSLQTNKNSPATLATVEVQNTADAPDKPPQKIEEFKKLSPLSLAQLKALLPNEVNGIKCTGNSASSSMGYSVAEATYQQDETTDIQLLVYDCAGEAGSAFYTMTYLGAINLQQESDKEYTKTIDLNGVKAIENFKKKPKEASLTFTSNNRLLVVLSGSNVKPDDLEKAAKHLFFNL